MGNGDPAAWRHGSGSQFTTPHSQFSRASDDKPYLGARVHGAIDADATAQHPLAALSGQHSVVGDVDGDGMLMREVGCGMLAVGCGMNNVGCGMWNKIFVVFHIGALIILILKIIEKLAITNFRYFNSTTV
jgi:hypothetical protein